MTTVPLPDDLSPAPVSDHGQLALAAATQSACLATFPGQLDYSSGAAEPLDGYCVMSVPGLRAADVGCPGLNFDGPVLAVDARGSRPQLTATTYFTLRLLRMLGAPFATVGLSVMLTCPDGLLLARRRGSGPDAGDGSLTVSANEAAEPGDEVDEFLSGAYRAVLEEIARVPVSCWSAPAWFRTGPDPDAAHGIVVCGHCPLPYAEIASRHADAPGAPEQDLLLVPGPVPATVEQARAALGWPAAAPGASWLGFALDLARRHEQDRARGPMAEAALRGAPRDADRPVRRTPTFRSPAPGAGAAR